mmetsp:Transcript_24935/g.39113  ORF Transcript_24935/g.39113 Transcript_24935/m.39113 type:complete len:230 (-) Transcript_24935:51-740(-)
MAGTKEGLGLCPFTATARFAGRPRAEVEYTVNEQDDLASAYRELWRQAATLYSTEEKVTATSLLVCPSAGFYQGVGNSDLSALKRFFRWTRTLDAEALGALGVNTKLHLVAFHPQMYQEPGKPDKSAHFARRSPYPMLNWVRAHQIDTAQEALGTGYLFAAQNEEALAKIGTQELQEMLAKGDWSQGQELRIDRNSRFSLFLPTHFLRFWANDPLQALKAISKVLNPKP